MNSTDYTILCPVDFSSRSISAAQHVKAWRERFGAALKIVHVVDNQRYGAPHDHSSHPELSQVVARRTADLEHFCHHHFGKNVAEALVLVGSRADALEHLANRERIDLVMLPRNHQSFIGKLFGDSIAAILLERSSASVWMSQHLEENHHPVTVNNILCALHFKQDTMLDAQNFRILKTLRQLVCKFRAEVTFLQVTGNTKSHESWSPPGTETGSQSWLAQAQDLLERPIKLLRRPGNVISGIGRTAGQIGADLVVVGRMRPEAISFGRQSRILKINHAVRCPVLSVW
jgi:nucleotide-binding universal stress UspA family protein